MEWRLGVGVEGLKKERKEKRKNITTPGTESAEEENSEQLGAPGGFHEESDAGFAVCGADAGEESGVNHCRGGDFGFGDWG
jgi:hypothetical protein